MIFNENNIVVIDFWVNVNKYVYVCNWFFV